MRLAFVKRFVRSQRAAAVIEFAVVVPIFFTMVWGIISFSRAYQRMNALTSSLREGSRYRSTLANPDTAWMHDSVTQRVRNFSTAFGYPIDTSRVQTPAFNGFEVRVLVTAYPLFSGLNFLGGLSSITVTREAVFRWERAP
jgi:Flp pilus assembly protein TadG